MYQACHRGLLYLFADDSNLCLPGRNVSGLVKSTNEDIGNILHWFQINRLTLNIQKTHLMLFANSKKKMLNANDLVIKASLLNEYLQQPFQRLLFFTLDDSLNWSAHLSKIRGKVSRDLGILCKAIKKLNRDTVLSKHDNIPSFSHIWSTVWGKTFEVKFSRKSHATSLGYIEDRAFHATSIFSPYRYIALKAIIYGFSIIGLYTTIMGYF